MTARGRGRPRAADSPLGDEALVAAGLALLDGGGEGAVTLRAVARRLGVAPSAVAHRTGGRDALLARVVAAAHEGFAPPEGEAEGAEAVAAAVLAYAAAARRHPAAVAALFARPELMPEGLARFTAWLRAALARADPEAADRGVALLVDYAHGHLLSAAAGPWSEPLEADFRANLLRLARWLLREEVSPGSGPGSAG